MINQKNTPLIFIEEIKTLFATLGYTVSQYERITKYIANTNKLQKKLLEQFRDLHEHLILHFSHEQIIKIGSRSGGYNNLEAVKNHFTDLKNLGLTLNHITKVASHNGGSINIATILCSFTTLQTMGFTTEQIVQIADHCGGSKNIKAVLESFKKLQALGYTRNKIVKITSHNGGSKHLLKIFNNHNKSDTSDDEYLLLDDSWIQLTYQLEELFSQKFNTEIYSPLMLFNYSPIRVDSPSIEYTEIDSSNLDTNAKKMRLTTS